MKNTKKRGFTIVELVIVIAVIAILASVLIPTFTNVVSAAKKSKALQEARSAWIDYVAGQLSDHNGDLKAAGFVDNSNANVKTEIKVADYADCTFYADGLNFAGEKTSGITTTKTITVTKGVVSTTAPAAGGEGGGAGNPG